MSKALRDHYLRIDARSLGLFRLAFALVLLADLFRRWRYLKDFYSNEGVLPNHNHLFNLREQGSVWSLLHAFSTPSENHFAFALILVVYLCFLVGYQTRVFHVLALVSLVSLTGRNILLENAGNYAAIALLAFTAFLPLGSRLSIDAVRASMAFRDEKNARELNDRQGPSAAQIEAERLPGWTPTSLAAFAVLAQIAVLYLATALQQRGAWRDGTALYYGLNVERWVSAEGVAARSFPLGLLSAWTRLLYAAGFAIPALLFIPFAFRWTRGAAIALMLFHGLTLGIFFSFGLYGWTLVAGAALLVPAETWERLGRASLEPLRRTVIYDADCGVCLLMCRFLKRLDLFGHLTFQGNDDLTELLVGRPTGGITRVAPPKELTAELASTSVIVVDPGGHLATRGRAVAETLQAVPLGWLVSWFLRLPGIVWLLNVPYDAIAARRQRISVALGKDACGVPLSPDELREERDAAAPAASDGEIAPATRLFRRVVGAIREGSVAVVFAAMLVQTTQANALPVKLPQGKTLAAVAAWPRMIARWNVLTPEPPTTDELLIIDAQTRNNRSVDPLTGLEPQPNPGAMRGTGLGQLWGDYLTRIHEREWTDFQKAFREYIAKGGPGWEDQIGDNALGGLDAYWIKQAIPAPGQPRTAEPSREKLFTQARGGRLGLEKAPPARLPDQNRR